MLVDFSAGIVRFTKPLPPKTKVYAEYSPQSMRITRGLEQDSAPFVFMEKTMMSKDPVTSANGMIPNPGLLGTPGPVDRMWVFWRKPSTSGVQSSSIYYKTYRVTAELRDSTGKIRALPLDKDGIPTYDQVSLNGKPINFPLEVSWDGKKVFFPASMERYPGQADYPGALATSYTDATGEVANITLDTLTWQEELPETALPTRQSINEGMVSAFADPSVLPTKIWVFWSSTRAGKSDLYYQTISPNFRALY
jgi:hypothetical protein